MSGMSGMSGIHFSCEMYENGTSREMYVKCTLPGIHLFYMKKHRRKKCTRNVHTIMQPYTFFTCETWETYNKEYVCEIYVLAKNAFIKMCTCTLVHFTPKFWISEDLQSKAFQHCACSSTGHMLIFFTRSRQPGDAYKKQTAWRRNLLDYGLPSSLWIASMTRIWWPWSVTTIVIQHARHHPQKPLLIFQLTIPGNFHIQALRLQGRTQDLHREGVCGFA